MATENLNRLIERRNYLFKHCIDGQNNNYYNLGVRNEMCDIHRKIDHELENIKEPYLHFIGEKAYIPINEIAEIPQICTGLKISNDFGTIYFMFGIYFFNCEQNLIQWVNKSLNLMGIQGGLVEF